VKVEPTFEDGVIDSFVRDCFKVNPSSTFSWFLICSYAYYIRFESLMSDSAFDAMSKYMLKDYDKLDHVNKDLVTKEMLVAGSGYNLKEEDYPTRVKIVSEGLIRDFYKHRDTI
jgi:hypothetical protein